MVPRPAGTDRCPMAFHSTSHLRPGVVAFCVPEKELAQAMRNNDTLSGAPGRRTPALPLGRAIALRGRNARSHMPKRASSARRCPGRTPPQEQRYPAWHEEAIQAFASAESLVGGPTASVRHGGKRVMRHAWTYGAYCMVPSHRQSEIVRASRITGCKQRHSGGQRHRQAQALKLRREGMAFMRRPADRR